VIGEHVTDRITSRLPRHAATSARVWRTTDGMALCSLHHKLFDRGMLGLDDDLGIVVSQRFSARTPFGRSIYELHGRPLAPRPGTPLPAEQHVA